MTETTQKRFLVMNAANVKSIKKGVNMKTDKIVVGLVGMPGSGKSLVVQAAQRKGYAVVIMGDVVREETRKLGLELNPKNMGKVMLNLRKTNEQSVIAEKSIPKIRQAQSPKVIVDGLRSLNEADVFKRNFPKFSLVAVHASPEKRFIRLYFRRRSDDPDEREVFRETDMRELRVR